MSAVVKDKDEIKRPPLAFAAMEMLRAGFEGFGLMMATPLLAAAPRGDGHSVLVLPGFATGDEATLLMRHYLAYLGYDAHPWRLGRNLDHRTAGYQGEHIGQQIKTVFKATGRKVSLVGWSLGGVIAREAARRDPRTVRQVVTIGSPFSGNPHANHVAHIYKAMSGHDVDSPAAMRRFAIGPKPLPMPSTAIYSRSDGVTAWENCLAQENHQSENVEVHGSHFGLPINPRVFQIIANRLSQPEGRWAPFAQDASP